MISTDHQKGKNAAASEATDYQLSKWTTRVRLLQKNLIINSSKNYFNRRVGNFFSGRQLSKVPSWGKNGTKKHEIVTGLGRGSRTFFRRDDEVPNF